MTVYIHFRDKSKTSLKIHNVASVHDDGSATIKLKMQFSDNDYIMQDVSHLAIQLEK